jgi:hypothetical protein
MRIGEFQITGHAVLLGVIAAYAAGLLILLSVVVSTALWPAVSGAF